MKIWVALFITYAWSVSAQKTFYAYSTHSSQVSPIQKDTFANPSQAQKKGSSQTKNYVLEALKKPLEKRLYLLRKNPTAYFQHLAAIFNSEHQNDSIKWNALMAMVRLSPSKAQPYVLQSLNKRSWYFKNAGLVAMEIINPSLAVRYAGRFLNHPSLILRTAAVETIRKQKAHRYKNALKQQLYKQHNFRNGVSLWIRPYIAQALAELSDASDKKFLLTLLTDTDSQLHPIALEALNKINTTTPPEPYKPMVAKEVLEP